MKFCKDCRYWTYNEGSRCLRPIYNLVTGENIMLCVYESNRPLCEDERAGRCGSEAKYFEPRQVKE